MRLTKRRGAEHGATRLPTREPANDGSTARIRCDRTFAAHETLATVVPCQKPGLPESHGLTTGECREAMWVITPDGRHRAAEAANVALSVATKSLLPMTLYSAPGVGLLQELAYARIACSRRRFPGVAAFCYEYPEECGGEVDAGGS